MDLFCEPADPVDDAVGHTRYLCTEPWDGGLFRTYAHRKNKTSLIPILLRQFPDEPPISEPYLENLYPSPKEELQPFLQTWLYFGVLAEMLSLNEIGPGIRLIDEVAAKEEISSLHSKLTREEGDVTILTAAEVLNWGGLFRQRLALAPDTLQRLTYLTNCLQYAMIMLHSFSDNVDHNVRYSIAALGEFFTTGLYTAANLAQPQIKIPVLGFSWHRNYMASGGKVESKMLRNGWCPSEIEMIRSQFQGVFTMHYASRLKRPQPFIDHARCTPWICMAFQMDISTYKPAHVAHDCTCSSIEADPSQVDEVLRNSDTYPVIRVQEDPTGNLDGLQLVVEPYRPGISYIALSHVWANGLGNPVSNSLPRCQIARISRLIDALPRDPESTEPPRLWLDTLCCPIELEGKIISLERIADVYRKAHHVLVLDSSMTAFPCEGTHPAELLVRAFGFSPWMRRLWTLQEGALARTLQLQYSDRAANNMALLTDLFILSKKDARFMRIWRDINNEFSQLLSFTDKSGPENTLRWDKAQITTLQRSLHSRTVSVAADEALCISTLMGLDVRYIAAGSDAEHRMTRVWEQLAEITGGISASVIFYLDEAIDLPGWRWAPKSLLALTVDDPVFDINERVQRFDVAESPQHRNSLFLGSPTSLGLKAKLSGYRLILSPRLPGLPLHPWPEVINATEDQILLQDEQTGGWFRIIDWYRSRKLPKWTRKEKLEWDKRENMPLCRAIDTGKCALVVYKTPTLADETSAACLMQVEDATVDELQSVGHSETNEFTPLKARRERTVIMSALNKIESRMMSKLRDIATEVAKDATTAAFLEVQKGHQPGSPEWDSAETSVRKKMESVIQDAWHSDPELRQSMRDTVGEGIDDYIWVFIPKIFSHDVMLRKLPEGQLWFVD